MKIHIKYDYNGDWAGVWLNDELKWEGHNYELNPDTILSLLNIPYTSEEVDDETADLLYSYGTFASIEENK